MPIIHPLLDKDKQRQARCYEKENRLLGLANMALSLCVLLVFFYSGLSSWLAGCFSSHSLFWTFLVYMTAFQSGMFLLGLPLSYYSGYVHEHKWGFSNHTFKSWMWERVKSFLLGLGLILLLMGVLFWIMAAYYQWWWLIAGLAMALFSVIFATLFPIIILPLFNKYTPIQDDELTAALKKILSRGGLKSSGFFKEDMSRQTKKENAFLAGLGKTRRVVLGDNLMEKMTVPEIESIIAHEVGHYKYRHIWKNIVLGTLQQLIVFYLVHLAVKSLFPEFLISTRANLTLFPILLIFVGGIGTLLFGPLSNAISRSFETQADQYALANISQRRAFITAMAGLANRNLANAYPEWWVKILYYSHPPIGERLQAAEKT
jgi:STE24 endopeptidase